MFSRLFRISTLALAMFASAGFAQDSKTSDTPAKKDAPAAKSAGPAVLIRVQSINEILTTADYLRTLAPEDFSEQFKQGIEAAKAFIDDKKGLEGIDVKKPMGAYITFKEDFGETPPLVILIPVADKDTLLNALDVRLGLKAEKEKDDVYKVTPEQVPFPVYFRFLNDYAYITINDPANIDPKSLPKPADVLKGKPEHIISASFRVDRMPDALRKMAVAAVENQLAMAKEKPIPNAPKSLVEFKDKAIDEVVLNLKNILEGGEEAAIRLNIDPKKDEIAIELELTGTKGSQLAKDLASIRENKSVVGGALAFPETALSLQVSVSLAASLKKMLPKVVDDVIEEVKKQGVIPGDIQNKAEPLIAALLPTVKAGELDFGISAIGPDKSEKYTLLAGLKLVKGKKIEEAVKAIVSKELPPEISGLFTLDAEKLPDGTMIHTVKLADHVDANLEKIVGKNDLHIAFRDDLLLAAMGPQAKEVLAKAIVSKPADVGVLQLNVSLSRIIPMLGEDANQLAAAKKAAEKVFGKDGSKSDVIRLSIDGGDSLKVKLMAKGKAIKFLVEMFAASKDN